MQMDADFQLGINLLKRFKGEIENIAEAEDETTLIEAIEIVKEPVRNATYRIKQGNGPMKEELLANLSVMVREFREYQNPEALKESAKKVVQIIESLEEVTAGS